MTDVITNFSNCSVIALNANVDTMLSVGQGLATTAPLASDAMTRSTTNQNDWAYGGTDPIDSLGTPGDGQTIPGNLLGSNNAPVQYVPGAYNPPTATTPMFYTQAQVQKMEEYWAWVANGSGSGSAQTGDALTTTQLSMNEWTPMGQSSSAQASNQGAQLKNISDTLSQQLQAMEQFNSSVSQVASTCVGLQSYGAQVISAGTG